MLRARKSELEAEKWTEERQDRMWDGAGVRRDTCAHSQLEHARAHRHTQGGGEGGRERVQNHERGVRWESECRAFGQTPPLAPSPLRTSAGIRV